MADLIDRQAALDALDTNNGILYDNPTLVASLHKLLSELPSAQQWIPVSSGRLPEEEYNFLTENYGFVICSCDFGQGRKDVRTYIFGNGHFWNGPGIVDRYVKAWMPLPERYRGDESAE